MKQKTALVLAGAYSQIYLIEALKKRGYTCLLLDNNPLALARPYADGYRKCNILDPEAVKAIALEEQAELVITCCADQVLLVVAEVSEELGLPCYIDTETAKNVSDKALMKRIFAENGIPTSKHFFMETLEDEEKLAQLRYPLVVKPADAYSSKGVRKAVDRAELEEFFAEALTISRSHRAIVEEYVEGDELTADYQVTDGKCRLVTLSNTDKLAYNNRFVAFRTRCPAAVSPATRARAERIGQQITDAFGLKDCPMLVQMLTDGKRDSVLEFCARTGGGAKFQLMRKAAGFDPIEAVIRNSLGEPVEFPAEEPGICLTNEFIYCHPGIFDRLEGFEELKKEGVIDDYFCFKWPGAEIRSAISSSDRAAGFTLVGRTPEELREKHRLAAARLKVLDPEGRDIMNHGLLAEL